MPELEIIGLAFTFLVILGGFFAWSTRKTRELEHRLTKLETILQERDRWHKWNS